MKNKKEFYITELHMGDDGLESTTDYSGPFTFETTRGSNPIETAKYNISLVRFFKQNSELSV